MGQVKPKPTLADIVAHTLSGKRRNVEPVPRMCAGHMRYVVHRFDIKGGISGVEVLARNVQQHNALYRRLIEGKT